MISRQPGGPLALVFATLAEAEPLLEALRARPHRTGPIETFVAHPSCATSAPRVLIAITGMGLEAAEAGIADVLKEGPRCVVNAGIAGALRTCFDVGDVLHVGAAAEVDGEPAGDADFLALPPAARDWLPTPRAVARLVSRRRPLFDDRVRDRLALSADLVDMEGARIAARCQLADVPCALVKAVSDHATDRATLLQNLALGARRLAAHLLPALTSSTAREAQTPTGDASCLTR